MAAPRPVVGFPSRGWLTSQGLGLEVLIIKLTHVRTTPWLATLDLPTPWLAALNPTLWLATRNSSRCVECPPTGQGNGIPVPGRARATVADTLIVTKNRDWAPRLGNP